MSYQIEIKDASREGLGGHMPKGHVNETIHTPRLQKEPLGESPLVTREAIGCAEAACDLPLHAHEEALRKCRRDVRVKRMLSLIRETSRAESLIGRHIAQSVPYSLKTSPSSLHNRWYAIHRKAAEFAIAKALRVSSQHDLKQIEGMTRFVKDQLGWYVWFCRLSSWMFPAHYKNSHLLNSQRQHKGN